MRRRCGGHGIPARAAPSRSARYVPGVGDQPRYLGKVGYVSSSFRAVDRLEAVSAQVQSELSARARRGERRRQRETWTAASVTINSALDGFAASADPRLRGPLRFVRLAVRRLGQQVERLDERPG
jgi:hypothetical protein